LIAEFYKTLQKKVHLLALRTRSNAKGFHKSLQTKQDLRFFRGHEGFSHLACSHV
jgi:hypothetical protein